MAENAVGVRKFFIGRGGWGAWYPICDILVAAGMNIQPENVSYLFDLYDLYAAAPTEMPDEQFIFLKIKYGK